MKQKETIFLYSLILLLCLLVMGCNSNEILIKNYVDAGQEEAKRLAKSSGLDQIFEIQLLARGSTVVYSYKYRNEQDQQNIYSSDDWNRSLENQAPTYRSIVAGLKASGIQEPSVIIEIMDTQGNVILFKEFK